MTDEFTISSIGSTNRVKTLEMKSAEGRLVQALDNLRLSTPAEPFAAKFQLLNERVVGGQALVQVRCRALRAHNCAGQLVSVSGCARGIAAHGSVVRMQQQSILS